jgi:hypothetical protein
MKEGQMKFAVYVKSNGSYVLIPVSLAGAEYIHGPLQYCDTIDSDAYPLPTLWAAVMTAVNLQMCAEVQDVIGRDILGVKGTYQKSEGAYRKSAVVHQESQVEYRRSA